MNITEANLRIAQSSSCLSSELASVTDEWKPDEPPSTILYAAFGRRIARSVDALADHETKGIFLAIEECFVNGDESARSAVGTGLLEALLNESSSGTFDFQLVADCLGEKSKQYCQEWDRFTGCSTPGI